MIYHHGRYRSIGRFITEQDAAVARDAYCDQHALPHARNFAGLN
jgi:hypothetical protein